jgi:hypothetical protein
MPTSLSIARLWYEHLVSYSTGKGRGRGHLSCKQLASLMQTLQATWMNRQATSYVDKHPWAAFQVQPQCAFTLSLV